MKAAQADGQPWITKSPPHIRNPAQEDGILNRKSSRAQFLLNYHHFVFYCEYHALLACWRAHTSGFPPIPPNHLFVNLPSSKKY